MLAFSSSAKFLFDLQFRMLSSNKITDVQIGQALPEYSVLISLIAVVVVAVFALMGPALVDIFQVLVDTF